VTAATDAVDGAERDPLDLELGLENLVRIAAQYDDEEADARAARFAGSLGATFGEALDMATSSATSRGRSAPSARWRVPRARPRSTSRAAGSRSSR
jgi:eukaryotic-like serine/threonine-protein kinase